MTQSRFTQVGIESIDSPTPESRFTQVAIESIDSPTPPSRFTQIGTEVVVTNNPLSRFTQTGVEVLVPNAPSIDLGGAVGQLWPRGGGPSPGGTNPPSGPAGGDLDGDYPDPTVVGLKGVPMVGTLAANQVWAKHATNNELNPVTPGTPSALYTTWDPLIPDTSPHSLNEEFSGTSLAAFTQIYTGDAGVSFDANTTVPGSLWMEIPHQQYRQRAFMKALPGDTNWTIHSGVKTGDHGSDGSYPGIYLADGVTAGAGSQTACIFGHSNGYGQRGVLTWAKYGNDATSAALPIGAGGGSIEMWLRLRKQSSVYYFAWSIDGVTWHERSSGLLGGFTPTHFGLAAQNYTGQVARHSFPFLRYYAVGTQLNTGALRNVYA